MLSDDLANLKWLPDDIERKVGRGGEVVSGVVMRVVPGVGRSMSCG